MARVDGDAGKGRCSPDWQKSEVKRVLCHEEERDVDDLHGNEEEGVGKETCHETPKIVSLII